MRFDITKEHIDAAIAYVNGENDNYVFTDAYQELMNLVAGIQSRTVKNVSKLRSENNALATRLERSSRKANEAINDGTAFIDMDGDYDFLIARTFIYLLKEKNLPYLSKSKVIALVYLTYAAWLESHKQCVTIDKPVATEWGPQFWKISRFMDDEHNGLNALREDLVTIGKVANGGLLACINNIIDKYGHLSVKSLQLVYKNSKPLVEAAKKGKNIRMKDSDIYYWQRMRKNS